jgi:hypothetical protein
MSFFSKLFGSKNKQKAKHAFEETLIEIRRTTKPMEDIGTAIIKASSDCYQQIESNINAANEKDKMEAQFLVLYEYIYFFMHLTMRTASTYMTEQQIKHLQGFLGPLISATAVESFFAHWPEELKEKIRNEFYDNLNNAELEYSTSKEMFSDKNPLTGDSLLAKLGRNISEKSGNSMNPVAITIIMRSALEAYKEMKLDLLVQEASKIIIS